MRKLNLHKMKNGYRFLALSPIILSIFFLFYQISITQKWVSKDKSRAHIVLGNGDGVELPGKDGNTVYVDCQAVRCSITISDFKDKEGKITYDPAFPSFQTLSGSIDSGTGRFEMTTSNIDDLFDNIEVTANLTGSTGFNAEVGLPGDQIPQGGYINYSTEWSSDQTIGIDLDTGNEIILGDFFLDSIDSLTEFEYTTNLTATFTISQVYRFSTGQVITGTVTKDMSIISDIPTLSQWGLIIMTLLLLTIGTIFIQQRPMIAKSNGNGAQFVPSIAPSFWIPSIFAKVFIIVSIFVFSSFALSIWQFGYRLTSSDPGGALISSIIFAYMVHLWLGWRNNSQQ